MNETTNIPEPLPADARGQRLKQQFKFRRVNEITGTFVLVVVAVLIVAVVWTGRSQRWFKSKVTVLITLPEAGAAGIRQGSEVYFLGTLVGSVSSVEVDEKGGMEARANIRRDFFRFVRADSSAVIKKKFGVAGDSFFEISRGEGKPLPEDNASIVCKEQFQSALEAAVEEIRKEALLVLKKTSAGLDAWTKLGTDLGETQQHLESVVTNLNVAAARLPAITGAMADEAKDLPGLVLQTQTSMRELERLIEGMQRHWLVRKYVNKTNPPSLNPPPEPVVPEKKPVKVFRSR